MNARYFSAHVGRFLSVDPVGGNPRAPQSWNRYSYVLGNPLKYVDPYGLFPCPGLPELECQEAINVVGELPDTGGFDGFLRFSSFLQNLQLFDGGPRTGFGLFDVQTAQNFYRTGFEDAAGSGRDATAAFLFTIEELFVPESQAELGVELAMAAIPGPFDNAAFGAAKGGKITGFTRHGLNRAISRADRGVASRAMLDAVSNPVKVVRQANGTTKYIGRDAAVVLNQQGQVVTVWARSSAGRRIP